MSGYNKEKHLASADMTEALLKSHKAYFADATPVNMDAYIACLAAVNKMLEPYYMEEGKDNVKDDD